jgi:hypothetical protein
MDDDVLGVPKAWQIKDFPEGLRNRIIAAAREANQSVAEYVMAAMLRHLDGEAMRPDARVNGFANRVNQSDEATNGPTNVADLVQLIEAGRLLKELPGDIEKVARVGVKEGIRQARGLPPLKPRQHKPKPAADPQLPAPQAMIEQ